MSLRILMTGISGFTGSFLAEQCLASGDHLLGLTHDGHWSEHIPESLRTSEIPLLAWDLRCDSIFEKATFERIEAFAPTAIVHLAGISVPAQCGRGKNPNENAVAVNVEGTRRVVELAKRLSSSPRLLFNSSSHVYDRDTFQRRMEKDPTCRIDESFPVKASSAYSQTKIMAEAIVREAIEKSSLDAIIVRPFQYTGPRQLPLMMLPEWVEQFVDQRDPVHVRNLHVTIDLSDVRDVVRAQRLLLWHGTGGEVYNVGTGIARQTRQVLEILRNLADPERSVKETAPGENLDPLADIGKIQAHCPWKPEVPIQKTIEDTYHYWQARKGK